MNEQRLRDALRGSEPPPADAREDTWEVVRAAYRDREPRPARRRHLRALAVAAATVVAAVAAAPAAPRDGIARLMRDVLGTEAPDARPALVSVPGGGRLLVASSSGVWAVAPDGSKRRLGRYDGATWSPHGLFALAWRGGELTAVEPPGRVRWSLARSQPIRAAAWSPIDGFRVAYVTGAQLRIVNGDGTADRRYGAALPEAAPSWRPDTAHVLAYADRASRVRVAAVDAGRTLWRSPRLDGVRKLAWAPDGRRLLALTPTRMVIFSRAGKRLSDQAVVGGARALDAAWAPDGDRIALARSHAAPARSDVVLVGVGERGPARILFTGPGRFDALAWSPSGDWLLVPWPQADQWLFLRTDGKPRVSAVANIARQFAPGARSAAFPAVAGWCCQPDS